MPYIHNSQNTIARIMIRTSIRFNSPLLCILAIVLCSLLLTTTGHAQWEEIGRRTEPISRAEFVCADGLYMNNNDSVYRYDRLSYTWIPLFRGRLLATHDSSMLYSAGNGILMFTENLRQTSREIDRPDTVIMKYYVNKKSVALLDQFSNLHVSPEAGRVPFTRIVRFSKRLIDEFSVNVHWCDSLIIAHHNDYKDVFVIQLTNGTFLNITDASDRELTSIASSHGHTLFNYSGRLSFMRGDRTSERTLQTPHSSTGLSVFGAKIIVFASDGTQYVTHDTGRTWEIRHILPGVSIPNLKSFVLADSLYVYNAHDDGYYATDSAAYRWWIVSSRYFQGGLRFTHSSDTLFSWTNEGRVTVFPLRQPTQRPEIRRSFFTDVVAGFTVADGSMVMFQDQRMFRSVDRGISWDTTVFERNTLAAGYSSGELWRLDGRLFVSSDAGHTWFQATLEYDNLTASNFAYHNRSYIVSKEGRFDVHTPDDSYYDVAAPLTPRMATFASFGGKCYIVSMDSLLHEFRDGRWIVCTSDYGYNNNNSLVPSDDCYFGVNLHWLPIRVDPTTRTETISFEYFPGARAFISGPYVIYVSPVTGVYIYTTERGTTSETTEYLRSKHNTQYINYHNGTIDLSEYLSQSSAPPSVSIYSLSGAHVLVQKDAWLIHTNTLSSGVHVVVVDSGDRSATFLINVTRF